MEIVIFLSARRIGVSVAEKRMNEILILNLWMIWKMQPREGEVARVVKKSSSLCHRGCSIKSWSRVGFLNVRGTW